MDRLAKELTLDTLPEAYRPLAEAIGVVALVALVEHAGGTTIYIPKEEGLLKALREARIKAEFNGYNILALARQYNVSERWVRYLCGAEQVEGQQNLYDLTDSQ